MVHWKVRQLGSRLRRWWARKTRGPIAKEAIAKYGPMHKNLQRIEREWPEVMALQRQATRTLKASGKSELSGQLSQRVMKRKACPWLPREKTLAAIMFIEFKLAGIEISPENLKIMGLEKEAPALAKMIDTHLQKGPDS